ncbi:CotY/CotZ family spore coat protein [Cytobacillus praedii]|uniref:Spore coat protein n=1 Tax=Cytobacillus praedii TaxID=1742358 RepID=A0A4R1B0T2_9BACI|nr:CotY/CotZ family spore coat protein [Cytobacillus praedii]TCJ03614.1 spore coat protein [Cytobacillus praedii]
MDICKKCKCSHERECYEYLWDQDEDDHKEHSKKPCKDHHKDKETCVEEILHEILLAQRKACDDDHCKHSYKGYEKERKRKKNTIPFILYCGNCKPFKASGVTTVSSHSKQKKFVCISSFIFKIIDLDDKCVTLELLIIKSDQKCENNEPKTPCNQIDGKKVDDLVKTGIFINVDLSCLCAITCLPAVCL